MQTNVFRSGQVSRWAAIDIKTLHAWVKAGKVVALPTHSKQLRFTAPEVHKLLTFLGRPIPAEVGGSTDKSVAVATAIDLVSGARFVAGREPTEDDAPWVHHAFHGVRDEVEGVSVTDMLDAGCDCHAIGSALRAGVLRVKEGA